MTSATRSRILAISTNFTTNVILGYFSISNIAVSVNITSRHYNAVILNPVMNNY